ncbi:MAG: hypothetical protein IKP46_03685 [Bacteroidales bacterium]|nr:hypothetical protein [Bacteroidales bacterium]
MRTRVIFAALAAAAALAACSRSEMRAPSAEAAKEFNPYSTKNIVYRVSGTFSRDFRLGDPGAVTTLTAGFSEDATRSHLELNDKNTYADVIWNAGDRFDMWVKSGQYAPFTTAAGGASAEFSTSYSLTSSDIYYSLVGSCFGSADLTDYDMGMVFGMIIPSEQTATAGSYDPSAAISGAISSSMSSDLSFKSALSLLKFSIDGAVAPTITSVTVTGLSPLAGETILLFDGTGSPVIDFDLAAAFEFEDPSNSITLSGTFAAETNYYIALASGQQDGLKLTFSDGSNSITKVVGKTVNFQRGRIVDFGLIHLGDEMPVGPQWEPVELYMAASSSAPKPVTIVVVPDGFTEDELLDYKLLAHSGISALFKTEPFRTYKNYFNVWVLSVPSEESGANITDGNGNITTARNCYFGSKWGTDSYGDMDLNSTILYSFVNENCPDLKDGSHSQAEVPVLIIINDSRYGGICHSYSDGKAYCQVPFTSRGGMIGWDYPNITAVSESDPSQGTRDVTDDERLELGINYGDWRNTLVHEFGGHAFGRLGDEYWYEDDKGAASSIAWHSWPVPMSLNISAKYDTTPWTNDLLSRRESLISRNPLYSRLGTFQGGDVSSLHRWRSEKISCMIDNRFYFSLWQRELIVKRIMTLSGSTFSLTDFLTMDNPIDPVRDVVSSGVMDPSSRGSADTAPIMPHLPPPVLIEE